MKTGILGGSFNPIHNGHLDIAQKAIEQFALDRVLLMVAAKPPHKSTEGRVAAETRYEMACAAVRERGDETLFVSDLEMNREGLSYTVDTLEELRAQYPEDELYLIMGADMICSFSSWKEPDRIAQLAHIISVRRPSQDNDTIYDEGVEHIKNEFGADVHEASFAVGDISSTEIRKRVQNAEPISELVPAGVEEIIYKYALYEPSDVRYVTTDLRKRLGEKRFNHSVSTMREAIALADRYGADRSKCRMAALAHDCEKLPGVNSVEQAQKYGVQIDEFEKSSPWLIHAKLGAYMIRIRYGIRDKVIADAIGSHTLGEPYMTDVAMITYLADCTEQLRKYPGVNKVRDASQRSLREGMLVSIELTEGSLMAAGKPIHPQTTWTKKWLQEEAD